MIEIKEVINNIEKQAIATIVVGQLSDWFRGETSAEEYFEQISQMAFWGVFDKGNSIGFLALKEHNKTYAELFSVGVIEDYRRISIGRGLFNVMQNFALAKGFSYLSVNDSKVQGKEISKFLHAMGFLQYDKNSNLLGKENSSITMIKDLKDYNNSYKCNAFGGIQ